MRLLNIQSSPRGPKSVSISVADAFLAAYLAVNPDVEVDTLNVWQEDLPEFDSEAIGAKYKGVSGEPMSGPEQAIWDRIQSLVSRFQAADRIVLGAPIWNFAYPYKLKQLIDLVCQRNMLFTFDGESYGPLLKTERALVIAVRGQSDQAGFAEGQDPGFELQVKYIDFWLRFIGVRKVDLLTVEHTWDSRAPETLERGKEQAKRLTSDF